MYVQTEHKQLRGGEMPTKSMQRHEWTQITVNLPRVENYDICTNLKCFNFRSKFKLIPAI